MTAAVPAALLGVAVVVAELARGGLSPNLDGIADRDSLFVQYDPANPPQSATVTLEESGQEARLLFDARVLSGSGIDTLVVGGSDASGATIADGSYTLIATVDDAAGSAADSAAIRYDTTPPVLLELATSGPSGAYANGEFIPVRIISSEPVESFRLDVDALDDDVSNHGSEITIAHDDTTYSVLYRVSENNTIEDAQNLPLRVFATDPLGNESTAGELDVCLSNFPPLYESGDLFDIDGEIATASTAFTTGDLVRLVARYQTRFGSEIDPTDGLDVSVDFSELDTAFNPFTNPATVDSIVSDSLTAAEALASGYRWRITAGFSWRLSEANRAVEARHDVTVTARDLGCGVVTSEPDFAVLLADLGPPRPALDSFGSVTTSAPSIVITGTAENAVRVEIRDDAGTERARTVPSPTDAVFSALTPLAPGTNRLVAVSIDSTGRASEPSETLTIVRLDRATLTLGPRFRPGDAIEVATLETPESVVIDIFDLSGDRVFTTAARSPSAVESFTWDGRNLSGTLVSSGPYVARAGIRLSSGTTTLTRAFVFTRK